MKLKNNNNGNQSLIITLDHYDERLGENSDFIPSIDNRGSVPNTTETMAPAMVDQTHQAANKLLKQCEGSKQSVSLQSSQRIKTSSRIKKQFIKYLLLKLFLISNLIVNLSEQALLTNIYGKRLSELKGDLSHRYLLLPSQFASKTLLDLNNNNSSSFSSSSSAKQGQDDSSLLLTQIQKENKELEELAPPPEVLPTPLAYAWKQQQQASISNNNNNNNSRQQQQQQKSLKLSMMQSNSSSQQQQQQQLVYNQRQRTAGAMSVSELESIPTEFPNPNINNLGHEISMILEKFFTNNTYDKRVRPNYSGPPVVVNVSFHIIGISSVDEVQMDFTTDFYFRQRWFDPRLEFNPVGELKELCVGAEFAEMIWLPDTFFANEKTATFHKATTENTFIRIGNNGLVYRSIRLTVTCSCPMDLQYFPMDRQRCKIEIESYGYKQHDIYYIWNEGSKNSVSINDKIELPQFKILGWRLGEGLQGISSGDYIRLYCEIHFVRSMGYYLFQIYIPASLIVMISWVSFWLHRNATPARVALGVTTVLTMTTLMSSTNAALPKISYVKSIDVFLGTCFVMVFAALLEYASVGYIGKRIAMKRKRLQELQQMQQHHQKVCVAAAASAAATAAAAAAATAAGHQGHNFSPGAGEGTTPAPWATKFGPNNNAGLFATPLQHLGSQTLGRRSFGSNSKGEGAGGSDAFEGSKTLQRTRATSNAGISNESQAGDMTVNGKQQRSSIKVLLGGGGGGKNSAAPPTPQKAAMRSNKLAASSLSTFNSCANATTQSFQMGNNNQPNQRSTASVVANSNDLNSSKTPLLAASAAAIAAAAAAANQRSYGPATEFEVNQTHDTIRICGLTPSAIDKHSRVVFPICFICFNLMYWIIYGHISQQTDDKGLPPLNPFVKA